MSSEGASLVGIGVVAILGWAALECMKQSQSVPIAKDTGTQQNNSPPQKLPTPEDARVKKLVGLIEHEHYAEAVSCACKMLFGFIREKSRVDDKDTMQLIDRVFSPKNPVLRFVRHADHKHLDTHEGYYFLLKGVSSAFRNPAAHENIVMDRKEAMHQLNLIAYLYDIVEAHSVLVEHESVA